MLESDIVAIVDRQSPTAEGQACLVDLLHEGHPIYHQRGADGIVRLRGWILLAFVRTGLSDAALACVLEELETGCEPYLVAAAARALRVHPMPGPELAAYVLRAIGNMRSDDVPVSLESYGDAGSTATSSPLRELLDTLAWLGPHAAAADIAALKTRGSGLPRKLWPLVDRALDAARHGHEPGRTAAPGACCVGAHTALRWPWGDRRDCSPLAGFELEDQDGARPTFADLMQGHVTIVAFFYTRCDNPWKCSLTIAKLAALQREIEALGLTDRIHIAAISYDGAFDAPERMRAYAAARGLRPSRSVRLLRATTSLDAIRQHFGLGVGFIESLVNRHRLEVYVLDPRLRLAAAFVRLDWREDAVLARATELIDEHRPAGDAVRTGPDSDAAGGRAGWIRSAFATVAALAAAFFPKCPVCWATYLSILGVAGVERIPYSPWLLPLLLVGLTVNVGSIWLRERPDGRSGTVLAGAGALAIAMSRLGGWETAGPCGVALTLIGSLIAAARPLRGKSGPFAAGDQRSGLRLST
jgi:protein SCO1/2